MVSAFEIGGLSAVDLVVNSFVKGKKEGVVYLSDWNSMSIYEIFNDFIQWINYCGLF